MVDKLVEECTETIHEVKMAKITSAEYKNWHKHEWTLYIVWLSIIFTINIGTGTYFVYYKYMNHDKKKKKTVAKGSSIFQTTIY